MNPNTRDFCLLAIALAGLGGCSSAPPAESKKAVPHETIQGKTQVVLNEATQSDAALNAGGPSVYLLSGLHHYRLFFHTPTKVEPGKEYIAEGIYAQKAIDEMGDPDQGKNGYPLQASCEKVIRTAWSGLPFDVTDGHASVLRTRVKRYPARPVFLVTKLTAVPEKEGNAAKKDASGEDEDAPEITVPREKQSALLVSAAPAQTAPLWEPAGGTAVCKVIIGTDGKIEDLDTGKQLCEAVAWSEYSYKPTLQKGKPVKVKTEVEVRFEPRK